MNSKDSGRDSAKKLFVSSLDQGIVSLGNFAFLVIGAHILSPTELGVYVLAYATIVFAVGMIQTGVAEAFAVHHAASNAIFTSRGRWYVLSRATSIAAVIATPVALISPILPDNYATPTLLAAITLPFAVAVDSNRYLRLSGGRPGSAVAYDVGWITCLGLGLVIAGTLSAWRMNPELYLAIYGTACLAVGITAFGLGYASHRRDQASPPTVASGRSHRLPLLTEYIVNQSVVLGSIFAIGFFFSPTSVAAFRLAQNLFGPLNVFFVASRATLFPILARKLADTGKRPVRVWLGSAALLLSVGMVAVFAVTILGIFGGELFFGQSWPDAKDLVLPLAAQYIALLIVNAALLGLRAMKATKNSAVARAIQALITVVAVSLGIALGTLQAVAWSISTGMFLAAAFWMAITIFVLKSHRSTGQR